MASTEDLLLDTHAFLWATFDPQRLSKTAPRSFANPAEPLYLSVASVWEMEIKHAEGKLNADPSIVDAKIHELGIQTLPIRVPHIRALITFAGIAHSDPFDRLIAAQALVEDLYAHHVRPRFRCFS